jgi:filamentous hemagglutinin
LATRSIPKTAKHHITNQPIELTQEDVFKSGRFGEAQNDRFSQPGSQAVYTSIGDDALQTVSAETGRAPELSVIGQDYFEPQKILDLTDETVVERIGISPADILKAKTDGVTPYAVPQIIGELAKKHGFDAILTPSAAKPGGINLILFP